MTLKYYLTLGKMLFLIFVLVLIMQFDISIGNYKYRLTQAQKEILQEKTQNRYRIEQVSQVASNIANKYPVVGNAINDVLVDLKENRMYKIDQKISDLPEEMQQFIIKQHIEYDGLHHLKMFDDDYIFPMDQEISYVPDKYGMFGWRPKVFDTETYQYVYKESIKNGDWVLHGAYDIVSTNPIVKACNYGYVKKVGVDKLGGNYIVIEHRFSGKLLKETRYYHLAEVEVKQDTYVYKGQEIGIMGKTGFVTDAHLHFELREWDGKRWIYKNAFIGTLHNVKWMNAFYYYKNSEGKWRAKIL